MNAASPLCAFDADRPGGAERVGPVGLGLETGASADEGRGAAAGAGVGAPGVDTAGVGAGDDRIRGMVQYL